MFIAEETGEYTRSCHRAEKSLEALPSNFYSSWKMEKY